jgi:hypothetical protein
VWDGQKVRIGLSLGAVAAVALAACGGSDPQGSTTPAGSPVVDCDSRVQVIPSGRHSGRIPEAARRTSVVAGPVVVIGARRWGSYPRQPGSSTRFKAPLLVEAGAAVTVTVAAESRADAALMVGRARGPDVHGPSVELRPCAPGARVANRRVGSHTPFLAGFRLRRPTCVGLEVEVEIEGEGEGEPITRRIPFHASCKSV